MHALTEHTPGQLETRNQIDLLEELLRGGVDSGELTSPLKGTEDECQHVFHGGMYARGLMIPAGTAVIGRLHRLARICIIAQGECTFRDEKQGHTVTAPWFGAFEPGSKTAVYAHSDTYWIAVLLTDLTDSKIAFDTLTHATRDEYLSYCKQLEQI